MSAVWYGFAPRALACAFAFAPLFAASAAMAADIPPGGESLLAGDPMKAFAVGLNKSLVESEIVAVEGQAFDSAFRLKTVAKADSPYAVQLIATIEKPIRKNDVLLAVFSMRTVESARESGEGQTECVVELDRAPHTKSIVQEAGAGAEWKTFYVPSLAAIDYEAGRARMQFRLGYDPQTIEIGNIQLLRFPGCDSIRGLPTTAVEYPGMAPDAPWRAAAAERIEAHRKADMRIRVEDALGRPVAGARVAVAMKKHAFEFGTAVNAAYMASGAPAEEIDRYRQEILALFNAAVLENDLKWPTWENGDKAHTLETLRWLVGAGMAVRGHCLVWPSWKHLPKDLPALKDDPQALRRRIREHILDVAGSARGMLVDWDVINEAYTNHDLMDILGREAMVEWFHLAREADPRATLYINDFQIIAGGGTNKAKQDFYYDTIKYLIDSGAPIGGIGLQCHFGSAPTPPERALAILDRFAALGLDLKITEFDVQTPNEQYAADFTRDLLTVAFSHPAVKGFYMWGFTDKRHWKRAAPIYDENYNLKPSGKEWKKLVFEDWWTNAEGETDAEGEFALRGFLGDYEIEAAKGGRAAKIQAPLPGEGAEIRIALGE